MGSPEFAVPSLNAIHNSTHQVQAVVSNPDKRRGRRGKPEPTDVKRRAIELGYPTIDVDDIKSDNFEKQLVDLKPDLFVVVAFRILPMSILKIPNIGSINLHASLLPKYRGAAPIHWAVINGEKETGCTVFFLDEKVDTGKIVAQNRINIGENDTTGDIYNQLKEIGAELLIKTIDDIAAGKQSATPQNDEEATPAPKLFAENTKLDFDQPAETVHNMVRGLNPFPIAWCKYDGQKMNVYSSAKSDEPSKKPGLVFQKDGKLLVGCNPGTLELKGVQLPGTKVLNGSEFINGYKLPAQLN